MAEPRLIPSAADERRRLERRVRDAVAHLRTWRRGERRAPHKPLLLLYALGRVQRGEPRLVGFEEAEAPLRSLLDRFGPATRRNQPLYPFWRLQSDGLWEVPLAVDVPRRSFDKEPLVSVVREHRLEGGFPEPIQHLLRRRPAFAADLVREILAEHFPESLHDDILEAVGFDPAAALVSRPATRLPGFRDEVLRAYEHRCAICGFRALLDGRTIGVEAAHVRWHAYEGPSVVENGLALCVLHHKLFDLGVFGISHQRHVLVSSRVAGDGDACEHALRHAGRALLTPQHGVASVSEAYADWHRREVFRRPERA